MALQKGINNKNAGISWKTQAYWKKLRRKRQN